MNVGARWDYQAASLDEIVVPANPIAPNLLPALTGAAVKNAIKWNSISPRIGFTYAIDESRRTLARASYSRFASQMNSGEATVLSTVQYSYIYFYGTDLNGDNKVQANELIGNLNTGAGNAGYGGFNLSNPTSLETPNRIGDYKTPMTDEIVIGADRQITRDFAVSANWTWRRYTNFNWSPYTGVDGNDYALAGTFAGTSAQTGPYSVPYYAINPSAVPDDGGQTYTVRPGYSQKYKGLEISATKRMSNNWMMRAAWSTNDHREYFDGLESMGDPTPTPANPNVDGGNVVRQTGGSGKSSIYMVLPKYQFILNGAVQAKWGITAGVNYLFRQGYSQPYNRSRVATGDVLSGNKTLLLVGVTDYPLPNVHSLDASLGKEVRLNRATLNFSVDAFNVLNLATVLGKQYDTRVSTAGQVLEIMNPRIFRLGVRIGF
jgi:hypothetical protein